MGYHILGPRQAKMCLRASTFRFIPRMRKVSSGHLLFIDTFYSIQWFCYGRRRPWPDCADAQTDLGIRCPHMLEDSFSHGVPHMNTFFSIIWNSSSFSSCLYAGLSFVFPEVTSSFTGPYKCAGALKRILRLFQFVVLLMRMHSPLFGPQTCVYLFIFFLFCVCVCVWWGAICCFWFCLKLPDCAYAQARLSLCWSPFW